MITAITTITAAAQPHWQHDAGWGIVPCVLFGLLLLGLIGLAVFGWFRRRPTRQGGDGARTAEDVLAERYAKGEVSDDEYMQRQSVLRDHRGRK